MDIETVIGYKFNNPKLLAQALTHSSYANENGNSEFSNERLEFLGDAVLELIVVTDLYRNCVGVNEGVLSFKKTNIVREASLAEVGKKLNITSYMLFGRGEIKNGGPGRASIIADSIEALIAAIYLDGGMEAAEKFVKQHFAEVIQRCENETMPKDPKTALQEAFQLNGPIHIEYKLVRSFGPDHSKNFEMAVEVNGEVLGQGIGKSKREAERIAAQQALDKLNAEAR